MMERDYFVASPNATVCELFVFFLFCLVLFRFVLFASPGVERGGYGTYETYEMLYNHMHVCLLRVWIHCSLR